MSRPTGRAIQIVERAIEKFGAPVYVRHEIVHNKHVVDRLKSLGAVFVKDLDECPDDRPVVFSAHGVPKSVPATARARELMFLDATCPLVSKVHVEAERHHANGRHIILIGHAGHPEVVGTLGQLPVGAISLIETVEDAEAFQRPGDLPLAYATQTTLSLDDTSEILRVLKRRFPELPDPHKEDICYATTNRQNAVKEIAPNVDVFIVVGSKASSNANRLREVAERLGAAAYLVDDAASIDRTWLKPSGQIAVTAGASTPEHLVDNVLRQLALWGHEGLIVAGGESENVEFRLPAALLD